LPLKLPKRSVITIHDVAFRYLRKSYSFFQYHHLNLTTKHAVKHADKIIVPSETTKSDLINLFNCPAEKISCVYHGFTPPKNPPNDIFEKSEILKYFEITPSLPYILFVGRLESKKNLARLVEAFASFNKKHPEYKLVLAGKEGLGFKKFLMPSISPELPKILLCPDILLKMKNLFYINIASFLHFAPCMRGLGFRFWRRFIMENPF
jgi:glycosyltransferase involved in cell wall biosynthesis